VDPRKEDAVKVELWLAMRTEFQTLAIYRLQTIASLMTNKPCIFANLTKVQHALLSSWSRITSETHPILVHISFYKKLQWVYQWFPRYALRIPRDLQPIPMGSMDTFQ